MEISSQVHNEVVNHRCPHCLIEFREYDDLLEHFSVHIGKKRIKCELCTKWFLYQRELTRHFDQEHTFKNRLTCLDCGKILKNRQHFHAHYTKDHMKHHNNAFRCCLCDKTFGSMYNFTRHLERHSKKRFFTCKI